MDVCCPDENDLEAVEQAVAGKGHLFLRKTSGWYGWDSACRAHYVMEMKFDPDPSNHHNLKNYRTLCGIQTRLSSDKWELLDEVRPEDQCWTCAEPEVYKNRKWIDGHWYFGNAHKIERGYYR